MPIEGNALQHMHNLGMGIEMFILIIQDLQTQIASVIQILIY